MLGNNAMPHDANWQSHSSDPIMKCASVDSFFVLMAACMTSKSLSAHARSARALPGGVRKKILSAFFVVITYWVKQFPRLTVLELSHRKLLAICFDGRHADRRAACVRGLY